MSAFGWQFPAGVTYLPGERPEEVRYQEAYEDDAGYEAAVHAQWLPYLDGLGESAIAALLAIPADIAWEIANALTGEIVVESREEYAQRVAERGR